MPAITTSHSVSERESMVAICQASEAMAALVDSNGKSSISGGMRIRNHCKSDVLFGKRKAKLQVHVQVNKYVI